VGGVKRPGIVHRIDKDTSGLLVVAKNDEAHVALSAQLKTHTVSRVYHAVCIGNLKEDGGILTFPIGRNPTDRKKMAAFPLGTPTGDSGGAVRTAVTHYTVLERFPTGAKWGQAFTYVKCELETGRTHQIRVHMSATGHPLLGDPLYGGEGTKFGKSAGGLIVGQMLHAKELRLIHPRTGQAMHFVCDLPAEFLSVLERLRKEC
jgi:23S rRNA pseudouridine1911/1915/1917 synthase